MKFITHLLAFIPRAHASVIQEYCEIIHSSAACSGSGPGITFVLQLANNVIGFITQFIGAVAVAAFIWGAVKMDSSGGNDEGRTQGIEIMKTACIGLFFALVGHFILLFVCDFVYDAFPMAASNPCV